MIPAFGMSLAGEGVVLRVEPHGSRGADISQGGFAASVQFYPEASASVLSHLETSGQVVEAPICGQARMLDAPLR